MKSLIRESRRSKNRTVLYVLPNCMVISHCRQGWLKQKIDRHSNLIMNGIGCHLTCQCMHTSPIAKQCAMNSEPCVAVD